MWPRQPEMRISNSYSTSARRIMANLRHSSRRTTGRCSRTSLESTHTAPSWSYSRRTWSLRRIYSIFSPTLRPRLTPTRRCWRCRRTMTTAARGWREMSVQSTARGGFQGSAGLPRAAFLRGSCSYAGHKRTGIIGFARTISGAAANASFPKCHACSTSESTVPTWTLRLLAATISAWCSIAYMCMCSCMCLCLSAHTPCMHARVHAHPRSVRVCIL